MTATPIRAELFVTSVQPVRPHADTARLERILEELAGILGDPEQEGPMADCHRIDHLRMLEEVKAGAAAAQARVTVAFEASQLARQEAAGVRREQRGRGIADQVALARGCPASQGARHLGFAKAMAEMPHTLALLTRGQVDEWAATVLVRETAILALEDRKVIDERLCAMSIDTATGQVSPPWAVGQTRAGSRTPPRRWPPSSTPRRRSAAPRRRPASGGSPSAPHPTP